jgi:DUF218 domain-containing protein
MNKRKSGRGFLQRRECLIPTWRGWLVLLFAITALAVFIIRGVGPFLAVNDPVDNGALVVEGWLPDYALQEVITEFTSGHHSQIYVTGGPLKKGAPLSEYKTFAELSKATLLRLGLNANAIQAVPAPKVRVDRTYASAVALKSWLTSHGITETNFNIISLGPHARRSRLLFERVFGKNYKIGTITMEDQEYDAKRWWTSSAGIRTMIDETIAYIYARLFFNS